jgi:hypothetical protein
MAATPSIDLSGWFDEQLAGASPDLLRDMIKTFAEALMGADADAVCGAEYRARSAERTNSRNGYRARGVGPDLGSRFTTWRSCSALTCWYARCDARNCALTSAFCGPLEAANNSMAPGFTASGVPWRPIAWRPMAEYATSRPGLGRPVRSRKSTRRVGVAGDLGERHAGARRRAAWSLSLAH